MVLALCWPVYYQLGSVQDQVCHQRRCSASRSPAMYLGSASRGPAMPWIIACMLDEVCRTLRTPK
jgi:hypothetical protein